MSEYRNYSQVYEQSGLNTYLTKVFTKMGLGLLVTAAVAAISYFSNFYYTFLMATGGFGILLVTIVQFGVVIGLSRSLTTMNSSTANLLFFIYAAITGFTFTIYLLVYDIGTVFGAFGFTSVLFISCAVIGHTTKVDLSKFSTLIMGALIALIVASVISLFVPVLRESLFLSYAGILIFLVLTAWDMQRIKAIYYQTNGGYGQIGENMAVYGAFQLYLDFINIFLYVLRILGNRSSRSR